MTTKLLIVSHHFIHQKEGQKLRRAAGKDPAADEAYVKIILLLEETQIASHWKIDVIIGT